MKKAHITYCIFFMFCIGLFAPVMLLGGEAENRSKRSLSPLPSLVEEGSINLDFPEQFDDYFADHLPCRNELITAYHRLNATLTGDLGDDQVIQGKEGWLFYAPTLDDYLHVNTLSDRQAANLAQTLKLQSDYMAQLGSPFIVAIAPNKAGIYPDYMPRRYRPTNDPGNLDKLMAQMDAAGVEYVDWRSMLQNQLKLEADIYYKTDTHWNDLGAALAYGQLMQAIQAHLPDITPPLYSTDNYAFISDISWTPDYKGDLADMVFPAAPGSDMRGELESLPYRYTRKPASMEDIRISTTAEGEYTLLMLRDSFANALIPYMSGHFGNAYYERETPFRYSRAEQYQPDVMVLEIAERNIPRLLDAAPVMPAPETADLGNDTVSCIIHAETAHGLTHIYGYADPVQVGDDSVVLAITEGGKTRYYAPFPILESNIADDAKRVYGDAAEAYGFSAWVEDVGEYAQFNLIKTATLPAASAPY